VGNAVRQTIIAMHHPKQNGTEKEAAEDGEDGALRVVLDVVSQSADQANASATVSVDCSAADAKLDEPTAEPEHSVQHLSATTHMAAPVGVHIPKPGDATRMRRDTLENDWLESKTALAHVLSTVSSPACFDLAQPSHQRHRAATSNAEKVLQWSQGAASEQIDNGEMGNNGQRLLISSTHITNKKEKMMGKEADHCMEQGNSLFAHNAPKAPAHAENNRAGLERDRAASHRAESAHIGAANDPANSGSKDGIGANQLVTPSKARQLAIAQGADPEVARAVLEPTSLVPPPESATVDPTTAAGLSRRSLARSLSHTLPNARVRVLSATFSFLLALSRLLSLSVSL